MTKHQKTVRGHGPLVLGIETSCDETAAAIVDGNAADAGTGGGGNVRANLVLSQIEEHRVFGGVVPEIAARAHLDNLDRLIKGALDDAAVSLQDIDAIAATSGPGLIGGVIVGAVTGKALALATGKPYLAINHLEGHALSPRLTGDVPFPYLLLLASGGHCQLLIVEGVGQYKKLGTTIDDAAGEAFDKTAKLLGLGYPGGPAVEAAAKNGHPGRFKLPRPLVGSGGPNECNFSFSGLKTAVRRAAEGLEVKDGGYPPQDIADLATEFQAAVADCLVNRTANAMAKFRDVAENGIAHPTFVMAGGVAANNELKSRLALLSETQGFQFFAPPQWLCTDNAAMIAWAGVERFRLGQSDSLDSPARARWPLDEAAEPVLGSGRKGAKA